MWKGSSNGGILTSDSGDLLLREVEDKFRVIDCFARCFEDLPDARFVEHSISELVHQRLFVPALGYEDLSDHDELRKDPPMAVLAGKADPCGCDRVLERDQGKGCAGQEHAVAPGACGPLQEDAPGLEAAQEALVGLLFVRLQPDRPEELVLDIEENSSVMMLPPPSRRP